MNQKKQADIFRRKYKLNEITDEELTRALNEQGYTVIEFNGIEENEDVEVLISELGLNEYMMPPDPYGFGNGFPSENKT